jgi:hypothetical protein
MNKLVVITGFSNPSSSAGRVAEALATHFDYDDFDHLTLGDALAEPTAARRITENANVFTHSAGLIALRGSQPRAIHAFNAPFQSSRRKLLTRTLSRRRKESDLRENALLRTNTGFAYEAISHPVRHIGPFLKGTISSFNPLELAIEARGRGVDVGLAYTDRDCYSHLSDTQMANLRSNGIKVAQILGVHDELILRPVETTEQYFEYRH